MLEKAPFPGRPLSLRSTPTKLPRPPVPPDQPEPPSHENSDLDLSSRIPRSPTIPLPSPEQSPSALPRPFPAASFQDNAMFNASPENSTYIPQDQPDGADEFSYALDGGDRVAPFTYARFSPQAPPVHLVTDVAAPLPAVVEGTIEEGEEPISMTGSDPHSHQDVEQDAMVKEPRMHEPVQTPLVLRRRVGRIDEERVLDGSDQQAAALAAAQASAVSALPISRLVHNALTRPSSEANDALRAAAAAAAADGWQAGDAPLSATEEALRHLMPPEGVPMSFDSTTVDSASAVFAPISGQSDARPRSGDGVVSGYRLNGILSSSGRRLGSTGVPTRTPRSLGAGPLSAMSGVGPADSVDMAGASIGTCGDSSVFHQQTQVEFTNATNTHDGAPTSIGGGVVAYSYTTTTVPEAWSQSQVSYATGSVAMSTLAPRGAAALHRQFQQPESGSASATASGMAPAAADAADAARRDVHPPPQPGALPDSRSSSATVVTAKGGVYDTSRDGGAAAVSGSSSGAVSVRQRTAPPSRAGTSHEGAVGEGASSRRNSPGREGGPEAWLEDFTDLHAVHNVPSELTQAPGDFKAFRKGYASQYAEASAEVHAAKAALCRSASAARQHAAHPPVLEVEEHGASDRMAAGDKSGGVGGGSTNPVVKATPSAASGSSEQSLGAVGSSVGGFGGAGGGPSGTAGALGIGSRRCDAIALQGADIYGTVGSNVSAAEGAPAAANGRQHDSVSRRSQVAEEGDPLAPGSLAQCKAAAHDILVSQARAAPLDLGAVAPSTSRRTLFQRLTCAAAPPPHLPPALSAHLYTLSAASQAPCDADALLHSRALALLYHQCTLTQCPGRLGAHWERLGFQGSDPATDFRGAGLLSLVHMLALFVHDQENARMIFRASQGPTGFPFALVSIHISKWASDLLGDGLLNEAAIRFGNMVEACDKWYVGTFYKFCLAWLRKPVPLQDISARMHAFEKASKKHVAGMIAASTRGLKVAARAEF
eukprot:jgi/Ulvmu1/5773/UM025_0027.1